MTNITEMIGYKVNYNTIYVILGSSWMPLLIFKRIPVFQLSNFVIWSNSTTAPVNISWSPCSKASMRRLTNLASRVDEKVVSWDEYLVMLRLAVTESWGASGIILGWWEDKAYTHSKCAQACSQPVILDTVLCKGWTQWMVCHLLIASDRLWVLLEVCMKVSRIFEACIGSSVIPMSVKSLRKTHKSLYAVASSWAYHSPARSKLSQAFLMSFDSCK